MAVKKGNINHRKLKLTQVNLAKLATLTKRNRADMKV